MKHLQFWFDPVSPYAYLAFERLPQVLAGLSYGVHYRPVLLAGLFKHWGQKGPAEVEPKRAWILHQVAWLAHQHGLPIDWPAQLPFNTLPLLRLLHASGPNRHHCERVLRHVWRGGGAAAYDPARLAALQADLAPPLDPRGEAARQALRDCTDQALAQGVFGVPSFELDGRLFWGLDALPMLAACLRGDAWFDPPAAAPPR